MRSSTWMLSAGFLALGAASAPNEALACGGTFCDVGPTAMPVDQTGENILFVMGDGITEAHVQIQYQGDPAKFAWVVPMQTVPDVTVGSQALFSNLLNSTVPSYGFTRSFDQCPSDGQESARSTFAPGANDANGGFTADEDPGVSVVLHKSVGAFEVFVLDGGTGEQVVQWLDENGFQQSPLAPDILARYVEKGFVFTAIRLEPGVGVDEIHPLTFTYSGEEACVPLELTAIAAVEDMGVRTFFLSRDRVVPTNYRHVIVNPLKIDWLNFGANYTDVISEAVDSDHADGQAFVTEYAGASSIVPGGLYNSGWDSSRFVSAEPTQVVPELSVQGLVSCSPGFCQYNHPMVQPILEDFLPRPIGVSDQDYYSCMECYAAEADFTLWDGAAFARRIEEQIIEPARHADELLADNPYLTRMFTLISPNEMTLDPLFLEHAELPEVPLPGLANLRTLCNGAQILELPDGQAVALPGATQGNARWPEFDDMPAALSVEEYRDVGDPVPLANNSRTIGRDLDAHNEALGFGNDGGCACRMTGNRSTAPTGALAWLGAGLLVAARRRSRG